MKQKFEALITFWNQSMPGRVIKRYSDKNGNVLASGMSFSALFSIFAAIWITISIFGVVLTRNEALWDATISLVNQWVPGLIQVGGEGILNPNDIQTGTNVFSWTGAAAVIVLFVTALGWLEATRSSISTIIEKTRERSNVLIAKLWDVLIMLGFGVLIIITAGLSVVATNLHEAIESWLQNTGLLNFSGGTVTLISIGLNLLFNFIVLAMLFLLLAQVKLRLKDIWIQLLVGSVTLSGMQALGSLLLGGASRNPLLATFAVFIGLLIWFNLISRVILFISAWIGEIAITAPQRTSTETPASAPTSASAPTQTSP